MKNMKFLSTFLTCILAGGAACAKKTESTDDSATATNPAAPGASPGGSGGASGGTTPGAKSKIAGVEAAPYSPAKVPGALAIELPQTLAATNAPALRLLDDDDSTDEAPNGTKAYGYEKLIEKTSQISPLVAMLTERLFELDVVLPLVEPECDTRLGADWTSCVSPAALSTTFTAEMFIAVVAKVGEEILTEAEIAALKARIDTTVILGVATVTKLTADPAGFTRCVDLVLDADNVTHYCFNEKDIRVSSHFAEERDFDGTMTKVEGTHIIDYVDAQATFTLTDTLKYGVSSISDRFTIKRDKDATGENGVLFTATIEERKENRASFTVKQDGIADDKGGFVATSYTWTEPTASTIVLSGLTEVGAIYGIFPASQVVTIDSADSELGVVGGGGASNSFSYTGPIPAPSGLKLWKFTDDGVIDSGITVVDIDPVKQTLYYDEEFGTKGILGYWCFKDSRTATCSGGEGTADAYTTRYSTLHSTSGAFDLGAVLLTLSGSDANAATMTGAEFVIMPSYYDMSEESPFGSGWQQAQLATGSFDGDTEDLSTTDLSGYSIHAYVSAVAAYSGARVYRFGYTDDGTAIFTEMTGITVKAE